MEENSSNTMNGTVDRWCCQCRSRNNKNNEGVFPPGYKFNPSDEELVVDYLKKKLMNEYLPNEEITRNNILEEDIYKLHDPERLAELHARGEKKWYFFTPRDRNYPNGDRPNRAAEIGVWKATGADIAVKSKDDIVGYRKTLVFFKGKSPKVEKTNWIMHEFRYKCPPRKRTSSGDMKLDDWVLCRIYKRESAKSQSKEEETASAVESALDENQIHQGGNNDDEQQLNNKIDGNVERLMNNNVELLQKQPPPFNPNHKYQTLPTPRNGSFAASDIIPQYYEDHQHYVPVNEIINHFFHQQQQTLLQMLLPVCSMPPPMYNPPSMKYDHPIYRADYLAPEYPMDQNNPPGGSDDPPYD